VRCRDAIASRQGWTYVVLTFDPKDWRDEIAAYRGAGELWNRLRSSLTRKYGRIDYIQTWEATKKGWPHVNILLHNARIQAAPWKKFRRVLKALAKRAGFGQILWVEPMRDGVAMAGYMVKLARELTGAARKDQVPVDAPKHFRRLRASRGILPKPYKNDAITGELRLLPKAHVEAMDRASMGGTDDLPVRPGRPPARVLHPEAICVEVPDHGSEPLQLAQVGAALHGVGGADSHSGAGLAPLDRGHGARGGDQGLTRAVSRFYKDHEISEG